VSVVRGALGALVALGVAGALVALSGWAVRGPGAGRAVVRLSWRAPAEEVVHCRPATPEELARLAPHMRRPEVCERRVVRYTVALDVDGVPVLRDTVRGAGARGDRPAYVQVERALAPGRHRLRVEFRRLPEGSEAGAAAGGTAVLAPAAVLDTVVCAVPGAVLLVTYDEGAERLRWSGPAGPGP
jgi:hypothetical protein